MENIFLQTVGNVSVHGLVKIMVLWNGLLTNNAMAVDEYLQHRQLSLRLSCKVMWYVPCDTLMISLILSICLSVVLISGLLNVGSDLFMSYQ
jgi:hypothetical protein